MNLLECIYLAIMTAIGFGLCVEIHRENILKKRERENRKRAWEQKIDTMDQEDKS